MTSSCIPLKLDKPFRCRGVCEMASVSAAEVLAKLQSRMRISIPNLTTSELTGSGFKTSNHFVTQSLCTDVWRACLIFYLPSHSCLCRRMNKLEWAWPHWKVPSDCALWFQVLYCVIIPWRHQRETFSVLLAICAGDSPVLGEFPAQSPVTRSFYVFVDLHLNKRLSKQSWGWWFETLSCALWRHCNASSKSKPSDDAPT